MAARMAQLKVEPVEEVPETASVCDYDEVDAVLQRTISAARADERSTVTVGAFQAGIVEHCECDYVKFTDYYRVRRL